MAEGEKRGSKKSKKPGDEEGRWVKPAASGISRLFSKDWWSVSAASTEAGADRERLTLNDLRNVVTIDLHFITLLIFVTD